MDVQLQSEFQGSLSPAATASRSVMSACPKRPSRTSCPTRSPNSRGPDLYRSGDRVRWRPDGVLEFLGRFDNQIKIRGHRVEPDEVAVCLAEHELVHQAVVVSQPTAAGANQLVAYVVPKSKDYSASEMQKLLLRYCSACLPSYMVPAKFLFLPEIPLKPNAKLDLAAMRDAKLDSRSTGEDSPLSSVESRILKILRDVLGHDGLGADDDFFEAGGDSLGVIRSLLRLESEFGRDLAARVMAGAFTARRLAACLESPSPLRALFPAGVSEIRQGTAGRPLYCLPGMPGTAFAFGALAAKLQHAPSDHWRSNFIIWR